MRTSTLYLDDLAHCHASIRTGSLSFHAASRLMPRSVRDPAIILYAFCRLADDAVDEGQDKAKAVLGLSERLGLAYAGRPCDAPEDRAFAALVDRYDMPSVLPEALIEGLAWDACGRRYNSLSELRAYSARVASAVGVMMCVLMGVRDRNALARACDLGVAMQLTNIARDVGEDARAGRLYLPLDWMSDAGIAPQDFLDAPAASREIRAMVARLLSEARKLYLRAEAGIPRLPRASRTGIYAARFIYAGIGNELAALGHDSISHRARTGRVQKIGLVARSVGYAAASMAMPQPATLYAPSLAETAFLVDAAADRFSADAEWGVGRTGALLQALAAVKAHDAMAGQGRSSA